MKIKILSITVLIVLLTGLLMNTVANPAPVAIQDILTEIGEKYGVTIIADSALDGIVSGSIRGGTVEEALKSVLDPFGYNYTRIENYYLVNGPKSPPAVLAETESNLVPVGFLEPGNREIFEEYGQYLSYDETQGLIYVKAPTSLMNKILAKLWEISKTSGALSVAYNLQIIDVGKSSDLDVLFSTKNKDAPSGNQQLVVTSDQWSLDSSVQTIIREKMDLATDSAVHQPWLTVLPGKTVQLATNLHYAAIYSAFDLNFTIKITPKKVDEFNGRVISEIYIGQDCQEKNNNTSQTSGVSGVIIREERQPVNMVSTTVDSTPGNRELLAVVRQVREIKNKRKFLFFELGYSKKIEHRDFMIFMTATPVNIQKTLATTQGLIPMASLKGLECLSDQGAPPFRKSFLKLGVSGIMNDFQITPWFNYTVPISSSGNFTLDYHNQNRYSAGISLSLDPDVTTSFEFIAGKGIGPYNQNAAMLGLGDTTRPSKYVSLFTKYYPFSYLPDSNRFTNESVWQAGARVDAGKIGLTFGVTGNPDYDGWFFKLDGGVKKYTWLFEYNMTATKPDVNLGMGFGF